MRLPSFKSCTCSPSTLSTFTPMWLCPMGTALGGAPSTTNKGVLPSMPASATFCACAAAPANSAKAAVMPAVIVRRQAMGREGAKDAKGRLLMCMAAFIGLGQIAVLYPLHQSRKLSKLSGTSVISLRINAIAACKSSRLAPVTRTDSP